jgi:hypothetical protein
MVVAPNGCDCKPRTRHEPEIARIVPRVGGEKTRLRPQWLRFQRRDVALCVARMARRDRFTSASILCCADRQFGAQVRLHHKKPAKSAAF